VDGDTLLVHLARPNKVWAAIQARPIVVMSVVGGYAYIPTTWRAKAGGPDEDGVWTCLRMAGCSQEFAVCASIWKPGH
jgi:transcriptional regulator